MVVPGIIVVIEIAWVPVIELRIIIIIVIVNSNDNSNRIKIRKSPGL